MQGHPGQTRHTEEFWQNVVNWRRTWQPTPVFSLGEPHGQNMFSIQDYYSKLINHFDEWTWIWAKSRRQWRTGKPGALQSMGSQRVRHDLVTELRQKQSSEDGSICLRCSGYKMVTQRWTGHGTLSSRSSQTRKGRGQNTVLHSVSAPSRHKGLNWKFC